MRQDEAKLIIIQKWMDLPADQRTENGAVAFSYKYGAPGSYPSFVCSGDRSKVIQGWLAPHIVKSGSTD